MIFVVYIAEGVIGFVSHELSELLEHIGKNKYHQIEVWNHTGRRACHW
jgi:hypothetical protein